MSDTLVLVNGRELAGLMIEYGVGVHRNALYVPKVDADYFIEE